MRRLLWLVAPVLLLCCLSCRPVPFSLELSKGTALASRLTQDNPSLITAGDDEGGSPTGWAYYPSVSPAGGFDYSAGFAGARNGSSVEIKAVKSGGGVYGSTSQPLPTDLDSHHPPYFVWPLKSGVSYLFETSLDSVDPSQNRYDIFQGFPPGSFSSVGNRYQSILTVFGSAQVIGASVTADPNPAFDRLHLLIQSSSQWAEGSYQLSSMNLSSSPFTLLRGSASPYPFIPFGTTRVQYFYDEASARGFASWYDSSSGRWVCYAWDSVSTYFSLPITHRIDALLSTGQLLSTEDQFGRLYDRDGNLLATFDLGNLVFIAEEYVGGQARCYFSQALVFDHTVHFNVYWKATSELASLGE